MDNFQHNLKWLMDKDYQNQLQNQISQDSRRFDWYAKHPTGVYSFRLYREGDVLGSWNSNVDFGIGMVSVDKWIEEFRDKTKLSQLKSKLHDLQSRVEAEVTKALKKCSIEPSMVQADIDFDSEKVSYLIKVPGTDAEKVYSQLETITSMMYMASE